MPTRPGTYSDAQVAGWKVVTDAVHAKGGKIVLQIWHTAGSPIPSSRRTARLRSAPSAIRANTKTFVVGQGFVDVSEPRALRLDEIPGIVADFRYAAGRAIEAGFDGVELHGAHGYLLDAFLRDGTQLPHRPVRRLRREPRPAAPGDGEGRGRRDRRGPAGRTPVAPSPRPATPTTPTRRPCSTTWSRA